LNGEEEAIHQPVLVEEVMSWLEPEKGGILVDLTVGEGGHARELLERLAADGLLYGSDQDGRILERAQERLKGFAGRFTLCRGNFSEADRFFEGLSGRARGVLMDLGVSSFHLDNPALGFSIRDDGPLDMRMDTTQPLTAEKFLNSAGREDLMYAIGILGEEPRAKAVVNAVMEERRIRPLMRTSDLRTIVEQVYRRRGGKIHPATKSFQGVRMAVNKETQSIEKGLPAALGLLEPGGRLAVIGFHSGEDRRVKEFLRESATEGKVVLPRPRWIQPSREEIRRNRRSRSARLRLAEKARA